MKHTVITLLTIILASQLFSQNVGVGTITPDNSAQLDVNSTSKGFLPPRMTTAQRDAIASPAAGLIIFNTSTGNIEFYNGTFWTAFAAQPFASSPPATNRKLIGGTNVDQALSIQTTADGGYVLAGNSSSSNSGTLTGIFNNGRIDLLVVKLDASANIQWQRLVGGSLDDGGGRVTQTTDGGYVVIGSAASSNTGTFAGINTNGGLDYAVVKLDASGNVVWRRLLGGSGFDIVQAVDATSDGGCIIAGNSTSSNNGTLVGHTTNGNDDGWIIKLDASGNIQWQRLLGGSLADIAARVAQLPDGSYIVAGYSESSNTGTLAGVNNNGILDCWVLKLNATGTTIVWQRLLGGNDLDLVASLDITPDNGCVLLATTSSSNSGSLTGLISNGSGDMLVIKLDASGNTQWQKLYGGIGHEEMSVIAATPDGGYIATGTISATTLNSGTFYGLQNTSQLIWVIKLNNTGNMEWQRLHGGINGGTDVLAGVVNIGGGNFAIGGGTGASNSGSFSDLFTNGSLDAFIIRLNQYGMLY